MAPSTRIQDSFTSDLAWNSGSFRMCAVRNTFTKTWRWRSTYVGSSVRGCFPSGQRSLTATRPGNLVKASSFVFTSSMLARRTFQLLSPSPTSISALAWHSSSVRSTAGWLGLSLAATDLPISSTVSAYSLILSNFSLSKSGMKGITLFPPRNCLLYTSPSPRDS